MDKSQLNVLLYLSPDSLESVVSLLVTSTNNTITISWVSPFSLNLTTAEPDIQYCVDVYNKSATTLISSECDITATSFSYFPENPSPDEVYNFKITPLSNIPGALNGTVSEVNGYVLSGI